MKKIRISAGLAALAALFAFAPGAPALAATQCKEIESRATCERRSDCIWVSGYKRKDGVRVNPYCRASGKKGARKSSTRKSSTKKSALKKSGEKKTDSAKRKSEA